MKNSYVAIFGEPRCLDIIKSTKKAIEAFWNDDHDPSWEWAAQEYGYPAGEYALGHCMWRQINEATTTYEAILRLEVCICALCRFESLRWGTELHMPPTSVMMDVARQKSPIGRSPRSLVRHLHVTHDEWNGEEWKEVSCPILKADQGKAARYLYELR